MNDTAREKIDAIEASDLMLAFDDCHKVYLVEGAEIAEASSNGYTIYEAKEIRAVLNRSCGLVFVSAWSLGNHPWAIEQGEMPASWYASGGGENV